MLLLSAAAAFVVAVMVAAVGLPPWSAAPLAVTVAALLPAVGRRRRLSRVAVALGAVGFACWSIPARLTAPPQGAIAALAGQQMRLLVQAEEDGDSHPTYTAVTASALAQLDADAQRPLSGRLRLLLPAGSEVRAGDRWLLAGQIEGIPDNGYGAWLRQNGIDGSLVPRLAQLQRRVPAPPWTRAWRWVQARVAHGLTAALPPREAAFAATLLFGGRHALPADLQADLNATGTTHLATVSAFNLLLLYGLVVAGLAPLLGRRRAIGIALALALAYGAAVGLRPPVLRGMLLLAWLALAGLSGRPWSRGIALVDALAFLLLPQPALLRDAAFQLTFAAACGITVIAPVLSRVLGAFTGEEPAGGAAGAFGGAAIISLAASLASLPVIAARFGTFSPLAAPANALVTPLIPAMTVLAFAGGLAVAAASWLAPVTTPLWLLLLVCERVLHTLASLPFASPTSPLAGLASTFAAAVAVLMCARLLRGVHGGPWVADARARRRLDRRSFRPLLLPLCGVAAGIAIVSGMAMREFGPGQPSDTTVMVLPVKGATALLLTASNGTRLLLSDSDAPAALAFALEDALPPGATLTAAIPLDGRATTVAALHAIAGEAVLCPGAPDGRCFAGGSTASAAGELEIALGGDERLRLSSDGAHPFAVRLEAGGQIALLSGQPSRTDAAGEIALVLLPEWSRSTSHVWLQRLAPHAVVLLGAWPAETRRTLTALLPSATVVTAAPGQRLRFAGPERRNLAEVR
jgi:ComEC/Rec2-related protein